MKTTILTLTLCGVSLWAQGPSTSDLPGTQSPERDEQLRQALHRAIATPASSSSIDLAQNETNPTPPATVPPPPIRTRPRTLPIAPSNTPALSTNTAAPVAPAPDTNVVAATNPVVTTNVAPAAVLPVAPPGTVIPVPVPGTVPPPAAAAPAPAPAAATQPPPVAPDPSSTAAATPATSAPAEETIPPGVINFQNIDLNQVLTVYAELVNRTILRVGSLAAPPIVLKTQTPLTKKEAIQALDAVLALNGVAMINVGEKFVKAVPSTTAGTEGAAFGGRVEASQLPDLGQYITHVVQTKFVKPSLMMPVLSPFQKLGNAIIPIDDSQILVLRDFTENIKRMLEMIEKVDVAVPAEFISEVIPIKYALASDIASALNGLSSGGSGTTVGSGSGGRPGTTGGLRGVGGTSGLNRPGGIGYPGTTTPGINPSPFGTQGGITPGTTTGGVPGASSFTDRLQAIIKRASVSGDIQILGQTKIIADERTNSLLIFASRADMDMIKDIISKLDVVLAQVLIESVIMEVSLDDGKTIGVSYLQKSATSLNNFNGVGAVKNGTFLNPNDFILNAATNGANGLASGFSYLGSFGNDLDITLTAVANDNRVNVLARPRVQTSHAVPANLFIGNTVPYITGTTFGDFAGVSSRSAYQEKQVGITLSVLPLINPDGLVVMDIQQDIEQLGTPVTIDGNPVPTTTKRSATAKVAVKDHETVILGGFISTSKSTTRSGVPLLKDLPWLGYLFRSTADSNQRVELIVLMRPTVLPTPEAAAALAVKEKNSMGGVRRAEAEIRYDDEKRLKQADKEYQEYEARRSGK